jgi:type IV secretion system protein VirB6
MADYTFLQSIFQTVDNATSTYITSTVGNVAAAVDPVAHQCFTLYVILWGFAMYRGMINEPIMDGAFRLMKIGIIMHFAINVGEYSGTIANNLVAFPDYLTTLIGNGGAATDSKLVLDKILSDAINSGTSVWEQGSLIPPGANPGAYLMALIIWISALVCTGYAAFLIILSKVALAVIVGIGPIFILCLMFEGTKKFFEAWLGQALNYALVAGLTVAVIKLLFGMYANAAAGTLTVATSADFGLLSCASMLILAVVCFLILMQVQTIASALAGGVSVSTMGAVSWASSKAQSMGGAMRPSNVQKAYRGMQRDARALKAGGQKLATPVAWAARKMRGTGNSVSKAA